MEPLNNQFNNIFRENLSFSDKSTFIVCAMFTPNNPKYLVCADRLARSCESYKLPYCIYEVAGVHKSLSPKGINDPSFTKAKFILCNLMKFAGKNILYVDADMFFVGSPKEIFQASDQGYDFAVYNWLNDEHNEAYRPINEKIEPGNRQSDLYGYAYSMNFYSSEQLICSGGVQFYANSTAAKQLLECWQAFVTCYPDFADDEGLDYVYNNFVRHVVGLRALWLDKSYIRLWFWPHVKPVIVHPGVVSQKRNCYITEIENRRRYYVEECQEKQVNLLFPADCIIDTKEKVLLKIVNNRIVNRRPIEQDFWIYPENAGLE